MEPYPSNPDRHGASEARVRVRDKTRHVPDMSGLSNPPALTLPADFPAASFSALSKFGYAWDRGVKGYGVRANRDGSITLIYSYRSPVDHKTKQVRIGPWPTVSVDTGRKRAKVLAGRVAGGADPAADKTEARRKERASLGMLLAEDGPYEAHLKSRAIVNVKTALSSLRRNLLPKHRATDIAAITLKHVIDPVTALRRQGKPGAADDLRKFAQSLLAWAVTAGLAPVNVLAGFRQPRRSRAERLSQKQERGRALDDVEIVRLWNAATREAFGPFGGMTRLGLLTGMRRGELAQLTHTMIGPDRITLPPEITKTGEPHEIHITPLMRAVLDDQPKATATDLVFPSLRDTDDRILKGFTKMLDRLRAASGIADLGMHDLRRTCRTLMSRLLIQPDFAEMAIGHVKDSLIRRYDFDVAWEQRVAAFDKVSEHIAGLINPREK